MRVFKLLLSLSITAGLIFVLNNSWEMGSTRIPPLGKFLDPFHGFWHNIETESAPVAAYLSVKGLNDKVTVIYDKLLIPHVFASNNDDLYLTQGFITAIHRLWQMEFQTHAAAGRISELIGPGKDSVILNYDRKQRRLGMVYAAENALKGMEKNSILKQAIEKYTAGVNQYISSLSYKDLPLEYKLMDYEPEPWNTFKVGLLLANMAQTLNIGDKDIEMTNALHLFGKDTIALLFPDREPVGDPIVDNPEGWNFEPVELKNIPPALPDELINSTQRKIPDLKTGSNNWAVSGSKTATGSPILCNDPHLNLNLPSLWYAIHLNSPDVNTMGVSLPGAPAVIIGFNDSVAWGMTNAQRDLVDWYTITYEDDKKDKYLLDSNWVATRKVVEKINVRGRGDFYDTVVYTHWGPVTYDENFSSENELKDHAFRWISHDESQELLTFYKLNRAKNYDDFMEALDHFAAPAQNFVFASVSGDIAMRVQGKFPVRRDLEGKFTLDGTLSSNGWQAFIPYEHNVMIKNPPRGFVSSANQYPSDATYPYYITATSYEAYRNRRINSVLSSDTSITVEDMMRLQNDNYNLKAEESLPVFLSYIDSASLTDNERAAFTILKSWNYVNDIESEGASYYEAWWDNLMPLLWDEMKNSDVSLSYPTAFNTILLIKTQPTLSFFDITSTPEKETVGDVIRQAFKFAVYDIIEWKKSRMVNLSGDSLDARMIKVRWADFKDTYIEHVARLSPLSIHVEHGGNHDIVNASSRRHGPSWRMIISLEKDGIRPYGVYPGGQAGNPGSRFYDNMLDHWSKGKYYLLSFFRSETEGNAHMYYKIELNPERQ